MTPGRIGGMPVDIEAAIREGIDRTLARNGLVVAGLLFVISLLNGLLAASFVRRLAPVGMPGGFGGPTAVGSMPNAPSLGLSAPIAGVLFIALALATLVVTVGAIRTFVTDETERLPTDHFTRNIVLAALNLIVGSIVFGIVVGIGFVLLVVPGFFLLVSLFFWNVYVIVEDRNFIDGLQESWALTRGHRWRLFGLGIAVALITAVVNIAFGIPNAVLPAAAGFVVAQVGSALTSTFTVATVARTFDQLLALGAEAADATAAA